MLTAHGPANPQDDRRNGATQSGHTRTVDVGPRRNPTDERVTRAGHDHLVVVMLRTQEVRRQLHTSAPAARRRATRVDGRRVVSRAQSYLRIPRC
jgi:hypothetical protein